MDFNIELDYLHRRLEATIESVEGDERLGMEYFLIGMAEHFRRVSGAGTPLIPPRPIKIKCPNCNHEF